MTIRRQRDRRSRTLVGVCCVLGAATIGGGVAASASEGQPPFDSTVRVRVAVSGKAHGGVTSVPPGIECGTTCSGSFPKSATVILIASPKVRSRFRGWGRACIGRAGLCTLVVRRDSSVSASFVRAEGGPLEEVARVFVTRPVLNVTTAGGGEVRSSPSGIDCPPIATCSKRFSRGMRVVLKPVAPKGAVFARWSGLLVNCPGKRSCSVTMNATTDVTATFTSK